MDSSRVRASQVAPLTQSVEYWSYEPKVAGSSPAWSIFFLLRPLCQEQKRMRRAEGGFEPLGRESPMDLKSKP